jgi:hypothetical protein
MPPPELCPVCETPQPPGSLECPTCGRERAPPPGVDAFPRLPELEPTLLDPKIPVPLDTVEGLEPTTTAIGDVPVDRVPELEQHRQPPVLDATLETLSDLEPTLAEEVPVETAAPRPPTCRYCGTVGQTRGLFCERCGMRLSRPIDVPGEEFQDADTEGRSCRACGARRFARGRCVDCGTPLPIA